MTEPTSIFIIDNGAHTIKANYSPYNDPHGTFDAGPSTTAPPKKKSSKKSTKRGPNKSQTQALEPEVPVEDPYEPRIFTNCLVRTKDKQVHYGSDIPLIKDPGSLLFRSPFERGLLTSWQPEHAIFNQMFETFPKFDATTTSLLITEPYLNPPGLGENYDQMVFEEWEFASYARSCRESSLLSFSPSNRIASEARQSLDREIQAETECFARLSSPSLHPNELPFPFRLLRSTTQLEVITCLILYSSFFSLCTCTHRNMTHGISSSLDLIFFCTSTILESLCYPFDRHCHACHQPPL